jgi:hypothetical protein
MHRAPGAVPSSAEVPTDAVVPLAAPRFSPSHRRVCSAFRTAIESALLAALKVEQDPIESVHEFRRCARRARSVLALVGRQLPAAARLEVGAALRSAISDTNEMRDRDVLPATLAELPLVPGTEEARARLESRLVGERLRHRRPLGRVRTVAVAAARLGLVCDRFVDALPLDLAESAVGEGFARLARRARKAVRDALEAPDDVALTHSARKRVRLLAAALVAIFPRGAAAKRRSQRLTRVSQKLGATLDVVRLAEFARRRGVAGVDDELLAQILERPQRRRRKLFERALEALRSRRWRAERFVARRVS